MTFVKKILFPVLFISFMLSCSKNESQQKGSPEYISEVNQWHQKRVERLKEENGWLTLAGLFWLKEGQNSFGSNKSNDIIFPDNSPDNIGTITLEDSIVSLKVNESVEVLNDGNPVNQLTLENDLTENPTILDMGSLRWYIIKRDDKYGIRLRDTQHPLRFSFKDVERYPVNDDWKIEATYEAYNPPKIIKLPTQIGTIAEEKSNGAIVFTKNNETYKIDAIDTGSRLWLIFADKTNGEETYGAGRYLYIDKPDSTGKTIVDFNYAYNPPCVFTKYATCAFPPKQNHLKLEITAGEKMWGEMH